MLVLRTSGDDCWRMVDFLLSAVAISLSGVMAPGPITAATLAAGARSRHAGALIALGHAVVEMPLILLLAAGIGTFFRSPTVKSGIGLAGGGVLVLMGIQLLFSLRQPKTESQAAVQRRPFITGIVLTGANPYFLFWWATVGLRWPPRPWSTAPRCCWHSALSTGSAIWSGWKCCPWRVSKAHKRLGSAAKS